MKILASDFDGTLYFPKEGGLRPGDIQAIETFQKQGHKFGLSTGRPLKGVLGMLGDHVKPDFYILCSGALVLKENLEPIYAQAMDAREAGLILKLWQAQPRQGMAVVFTQGEVFVPDDFYNTDFVRNNPFFRQVFLPLSQLGDRKVYGISLKCGSAGNASDLLAQMEQAGLFTHTQGYQNCDSIDLVAAGCSKAQGLEELKKYYGIAQPIACIGDSYNDLPMLKATPLSFTFTTSPREVQDQTAYQVESEAQAISILLELEEQGK